MTAEIHMKTQDVLAGLYSNPLEQSRNVGTVSNPEDRPAFDDLFEDPDPAAEVRVPTPPPAITPSHPADTVWNDELDLPDFVTPAADASVAHSLPAAPHDEPTPVREMSNVNVIDAVGSIPDPSNDAAPAEHPQSAVYGGPEFVAPMEDFNSGFSTPVEGQSPSTPHSPAPAGRLYRSSGAEGPAAAVAIPALDRDPIRISTDPVASPAAAYQPAGPASPSSDRSPSTAFASSALLEDELDESPAPPSESPRSSMRISGQVAGLTYNGAAVVIMAATILVGFVDALLNHKLGWLTGVALVASSVYAALNVRPADAWAPAILAPLGFMAATLTAGQLTRGGSGSWFIREGYMIFRSLAVNAPWIIGATVICAAIAFWRRRSA